MLRTLIIFTFISYAVGQGVVKTCTSSVSPSDVFCVFDSAAVNNEYYVIEKNPDSNCAIEPTNGEVDLSVLDTQGLPMYIGQKAFYNCAELTSIVLPESLERIGYYAFLTTSFTEISIPKSVKYIGTYALYKTGLIVNLPVGSITEIAELYDGLSSTNVYVGTGSSIGTIRGCQLLWSGVTEDICPLGCTDSNYFEYDSSAVLYDGSCATFAATGINATDCQALKAAFKGSSCCTA